MVNKTTIWIGIRILCPQDIPVFVKEMLRFDSNFVVDNRCSLTDAIFRIDNFLAAIDSTDIKKQKNEVDGSPFIF